jgi:hypothetical protein
MKGELDTPANTGSVPTNDALAQHPAKNKR